MESTVLCEFSSVTFPSLEQSVLPPSLPYLMLHNDLFPILLTPLLERIYVWATPAELSLVSQGMRSLAVFKSYRIIGRAGGSGTKVARPI